MGDLATLIDAHALPSSTRDPSISLTGEANDSPPGASATITIEIFYRFRSSPNGAWGAWSLSGTPMTGPNPWSFSQPLSFPNGNGYYEFYSIATDAAGNRELPPITADASIRKR